MTHFSLLLPVILAFSPLARAEECNVSRAPDRIVVIGDSHMQRSTGPAFQDRLRELVGARTPVVRYAVQGAASAHWAADSNAGLAGIRTQRFACERSADATGEGAREAFPASFPSARAAMGDPAPKAAIIELGSNEICFQSEAQTQTSYRNLIARVPPQTKCVILGPAIMEKESIVRACGGSGGYRDRIEKFRKFISEFRVTGAREPRCQYVDSLAYRIDRPPPNEMTNASCHSNSGRELVPDDGDGVHYLPALGIAWGKCAALSVSAILGGAGPGAASPPGGAPRTAL